MAPVSFEQAPVSISEVLFGQYKGATEIVLFDRRIDSSPRFLPKGETLGQIDYYVPYLRNYASACMPLPPSSHLSRARGSLLRLVMEVMGASPGPREVPDWAAQGAPSANQRL